MALYNLQSFALMEYDFVKELVWIGKEVTRPLSRHCKGIGFRSTELNFPTFLDIWSSGK
jgi:hypothetical protein